MLFAANDKLFLRELKILNYDEIRSFDWTKLVYSYWLVNIDTASLIPTDLMIWLVKHRVKTWLLTDQTLQILWESVHIFTHALGSLFRSLEAAISLPASKICKKTKLQQFILNVNQQLEHSVKYFYS